MRKGLFFGCLFLLIGLLIGESLIRKTPGPGFVYVKNNGFQCNGESFFPIMLNYIVEYQEDEDGSFILAPCIEYDSAQYVEAVGKEAVSQQLAGHFQLIKELGFNTIRVCFDRVLFDDSNHPYYPTNGRHFYLNQRNDRNAIFKGVESLLRLAEERRLRVMLLIKPPIENDDLEVFTVELLQHFSKDSTLFAYDFMNEPLYFDTEENRLKTDAQNIVEHWRRMVRKNAPNQLFTVGFSEPIEVFEWDAAMLPVDFVEIHTYHPLRIPNEIYWYAKHVGKPWMVGETGLPADGDSISYAAQRDLFEAAYSLTRDAGGCGFGWWEFQELSVSHFEARYTGLLNHQGITQTADGKHIVKGTLKITPEQISEIINHYVPNEVKRPVNYYNMMGYQNIVITGEILDSATTAPVEGAVIRGWNEDWSVGMNTYSDENGHFTLYCNDPCTHFEISAPQMSKVKFNRHLSYLNQQGVESNVNNLKDNKLEYHHISYHPFLKENPRNIFDFDSQRFSNADYTANLGTIILSQIKK